MSDKSLSGRGNMDYYEQTGVAMTCRSYEEYVRMFNWTLGELEAGPILDVAGGASSFAAEARSRGLDVRSADPLYRLSLEEMQLHGSHEHRTAAGKLESLQHRFDWSYYGSLEGYKRLRESSLQWFLDDYKLYRDTDRYTAASLPILPFGDGAFQTVVCSHFLFLYAEQFGQEFHRDALLELLRVCRLGGEVRVYPLLDLKWNMYSAMDQLLEDIVAGSGESLQIDMPESKLPFIPGSSKLLRIRKMG